MLTKLSSKGQVVLPKQARARLQLRPGAILKCVVCADSIVLTPERAIEPKRTLVKDPGTGLIVTRSSNKTKITSEDVRAALADFP